MRIRTGIAAVALATGLALPRHVAAQNASMAVTAQVTFLQLTIQATQNLDFGTVVPGVPTTIDPQASFQAAKFVVRGFPFAQFTFDLALPTILTTGGGPNVIPIAYGATSGCHRNQDQQALCTYYNPTTTLTQRIRFAFPPNATYFVWLGATVTPSPTQFPGVYSGVATATVAYTGN